MALGHVKHAAARAEKAMAPRKVVVGHARELPRDDQLSPARRDRRDRSVELPAVHADGLDRVRARRRQRGRVEAERADAARSRSKIEKIAAKTFALPDLLQVVTGAGATGAALAKSARRQDRVHGLGRDRQARDDGRRRAPHAGAARARRQGSDDRRRRRGPREGRGGRASTAGSRTPARRASRSSASTSPKRSTTSSSTRSSSRCASSRSAATTVTSAR